MSKNKTKYTCEYCGAKSNNGRMCKNCREKAELIRKIKAMLKPYYNKKKGKKNENT